MKTIAETTPSQKPYIPLPWEVLHEFARMIFAGCVVTFGPRRGHRRKLVEELELLHSRLSSLTLETSTAEVVRKTVDGAERSRDLMTTSQLS